MRKIFAILVAAVVSLCLLVPTAFAAVDLDSLSGALEGIDVSALSDSELSSVLEGLNLEGLDLDAVRSAFDSGSSGSDALAGITDTLGALSSGDSDALSGITDTIGSLGGSSLGGSAISADSLSGLSDMLGGMDMSFMTDIFSDPSSVIAMFTDAGSGSSGGFDLSAIMDMIGGSFGGSGLDLSSLTSGMDLGSFDITSVLGGLGGGIGGGDAAGGVSDIVATITDALKGGLEKLGMDPSMLDGLMDNDIVNFFANMFIGLGDVLNLGGDSGSSSSSSSSASVPVTPNTGDTSAVLVALGTISVAAAAAFVCLMKKD